MPIGGVTRSAILACLAALAAAGLSAQTAGTPERFTAVEKLLDTLTSLPRVGYFRTPNSIGYDLHYAQRDPLPDGGERVVLATDRHISFWEAANQPRSIDYPFTVIELRLNAEGAGEGKMSLAARITGDKESRLIMLENYATQPVMLNDVRREKMSH
jgi:hypothetical protein